MSLVKQLQDSLDGEELVEALTVMRLIWLRRTSFMFNREFTTSTQLLTKAKELVEFFSRSNTWGAFEREVAVPTPPKWTSCPGCWVKLN
jgi:hypothetical protein